MPPLREDGRQSAFACAARIRENDKSTGKVDGSGVQAKVSGLTGDKGIGHGRDHVANGVQRIQVARLSLRDQVLAGIPARLFCTYPEERRSFGVGFKGEWAFWQDTVNQVDKIATAFKQDGRINVIEF